MADVSAVRSFGDDDRRERILDAVSEIVLERGTSGLTTALAARRARVAPGKFYELFSDKYDALQAAADRNLRRYFDAVGEALDERPDLDFAELARVALEVWIDLCREDPGFRALHYWRSPADADGEGDDRVLGVWTSFVGDRLGMRDSPQLRREAVLVTRFVMEPIDYAFELDPNGHAEVLAKVRRVLDCLLE